ncbi:Cro/CI family transcriptional regulator [Candidatus Francisella endociliophora]|uniref:Cro/CI family transcriptional regulator n=1 Tax=Candidatus Francisella endociliophora TaxID=653937 RepID=UPI0009DDCC72|nr:Cro/CI family transcriptional regulator [Francisella sp. FSC1006]
MNIQEVLNYFGNQNKLALALGVTRAAVGRWVKDGEIPPKRQIQIQRLTKSKIKVS